MNDKATKRWLIKDKDARVRGPLSTEEVLRKIQTGELSGDELIAPYPSTDWFPITKDPVFYDRLLETLQKEDNEIEVDVDHPKPDNIVSQRTDEMPDDFIVTSSAKTSSAKTTKAEKTENTTSRGGNTKKVEPNRAERVTKTQRTDENEKNRPREKDKVKQKQSRHEDIELDQRKKILKKAKTKKSAAPMVLVILTVLFALYYITSVDESSDGRIHLDAPRAKQPAKSAEEVKVYVGNAVAYFSKDTLSNYLRAQDELVRAIEGDPRNTGAMALLCLSYHELWPFATQDAADLQAVSSVTQMASGIDTVSIETSTCRTVDYLLRGKIVEARALTETVLESFGGSGQPPIAFYYFKSRLLDFSKDYNAAVDYIVSAQKLWPTWIRLFYVEAELREKLNDPQGAANRYSAVLKANPEHSAAKISLGHIEYLKLKNYQKGKDLLQQGIGSKEKAASDVLAKGYLSLAEIALVEKNSGEAVSYAQKAYSLNASNARAKQIIISLGGDEKLKSTKIADSQLIYEGDQLVREGDCNAAQAYYKAAFERNNKNGIAAMKAAECLWSMSLSTEAIEWLNKAITADPKLIDAYTLMADYFTRRYNFTSAAGVLNKAREIAPQNYKVYRGFALVELRRNSSDNAANYAEKAIQLYASDVDSYVILARARLKQNDAAKAFSAASRAVEIDQNNREVQVVYAEALSAARGAYVGIDYLNRLVETYPTTTEYRLALGQMYMKEQSYSNAENVFQQIIRIEEKPKAALIELGQALQMQKRYEEAQAAYFKAAALDPADVEPIFRVGLMFLEAQRPTEARQQFNRVLTVNKEYPLVNYYIGKAALQMQSYDEALKQAELEKSRNPSLADSYILAAEAYTEQKQYSLCASEYQKAIKLRANIAVLYVKLASCYRLAGNLDVAEMTINQANKLESGNPDVWKELAAVNETRGNKIKAIEAYNQYIVLAPNAPDRAQIEARIMVLSR